MHLHSLDIGFRKAGLKDLVYARQRSVAEKTVGYISATTAPSHGRTGA